MSVFKVNKNKCLRYKRNLFPTLMPVYVVFDTDKMAKSRV